MTNEEKLNAIADIFELTASDINLDTKLDTLSWDSMAMLSVIALANAQGKKVSGAQVREMKTVADIMASI